MLDHIQPIIGVLFMLLSLGMLYFVFKPRKKTHQKSCDIFLEKQPKVISQRALRDDEKIEVVCENNPEMPIEFDFNEKDVDKYIYKNLSDKGKDGAPYNQLKNYCWICVTQNKFGNMSSRDFDKMFRAHLFDLRSRGMVSYKKKTKHWVIRKSLAADDGLKTLTEKEKRYFSVNKLGSGWHPLSDRADPLVAIDWIHRNLTPDEFEKLCCAMLAHHGVKDVKVTAKRKSGADGGLDGTGIYNLDGADVKAVMQAKRYRPDIQIGTEEIQKFSGTLYLDTIKYGFFITTSLFSRRAIQKIKETNSDKNKELHIELLDKNKIIELLIYRGNAAHGLGLHRTDLGLYYLNPALLRRELEKF